MVSEVDIRTLLEATLFGAGRSLSVDEFAESMQTTPSEIVNNLESLQNTM